MNSVLVSSEASALSSAGALTINTSQISTGMLSDGMSEPSSPESSFDTSDLLANGMSDEITIQLAASGTVGMAAAAAIASGIRRKNKRPHIFETNPSIRKRQQTRILRKLKATIEEYTTRIGQQAVVLCCTPGKSSNSHNNYKVFGSQPLENVVRSCKGVVLQDLESTLSEQLPASHSEASGLHELPPLSIDGIPTSVDQMTQAQLRTFIPEMLKYSTGRSKPGWGKMECIPVWWPKDIPWANVRSDVRSAEEKKRVSWTEALKMMVKNCYIHHGRDDLLYFFSGDQEHHNPAAQTMLQTINNPDGTVSIIQLDTGPNHVVTLPDGTQATVVNSVSQVPQEATHAVQTLAEAVASSQEIQLRTMTPVQVEMNVESVGHGMATISDDGHIILTGDGNLPGTGLMTIPGIPVSMYHQMGSAVTSLAQLQQHGSIQVITKQEPGGLGDMSQEVMSDQCVQEVIHVMPNSIDKDAKLAQS
ncbi:DNA-binding protein P3A2-like [Mizuhopecten yessoensis]|uniref:DNA-binding protein P3A2 n=1 Tax=Mizuhopecten yessoensis TaxID=6573 RepID=A0A210QSF6_MIZYE|nr:DNA-binding protein P3A2-like [Mizuhopecten yessoensis]XP_021350949.1 DNA-binding protein P3A2-like [Mizuhopecten yessoensis]OWF51628.1 DNA-binding protein P3A2 [Mizuhopecten yessoensis]